MNHDLQISQAELLRRIRQGWDAFQTYLATLSHEQATGPIDAAGWTAKDHIAHLARWEEGMVALINGQNRRAAMGVDEAAWNTHDYDIINAQVRDRDAYRSLDEVKKLFEDIHGQLVAAIERMSDEDVMRPYKHYQGSGDNETPVAAYIVSNTFEHYAEHRPWIDAIASRV